MSYSSEKFCLKWNDFQQNITTSYHDLRTNKDLSDVTLVCEENEQNHLSCMQSIFSALCRKVTNTLTQ